MCIRDSPNTSHLHLTYISQNYFRMSVPNRLRLISLTIICSLACFFTEAQVKKRIIHYHKVDTAAMELNSRISDSILREAEIKDTTVPYMVNKIESYTFSLNRAEGFFDRRFDTTDILKSLSALERGLNFFHNRINRNDNPLNLRTLNTSSVMLGESQERLEDWNKELINYSTQLNAIHERIRVVKHDSSLQNDSLNTMLHGQMNGVYMRSLSLDTILHVTTIKINTLRNRVSIDLSLIHI